MPRICQQRGGNVAAGRLTYVHSTLFVGLRVHTAHVGATHVSKETATSICGTATGTRSPADFFPVAIRAPQDRMYRSSLRLYNSYMHFIDSKKLDLKFVVCRNYEEY